MNNTEFYSPLQKSADDYRARARALLSNKNYGMALLVSFVASILGATSSGGITSSLNFDGENSETLKQLFTAPDPLGMISAFLPLIIFTVSLGIISTIAFSLFVSSPVMLGYQKYLLALNDGNEGKKNVSTLFDFFTSATYWKSVLLNLLHSLILGAAVIPMLVGLIAAAILIFIPFMLPLALLAMLCGCGITVAIALPLSYTYTYAHMIMAEYPTLTPVEALRNSRTLMHGKRRRLFCLDFSFIGWILLSILTLGIGFIFLAPYMHAARVAFYHDVANRDAAKETEFPSLDPDDYATEE